MKRVKRVLALLCIVIVLTSLPGCGSNQTQQEKFDDFLNEVFVDEVTSDSLSLHFLLAHPENYGIKDFKTTLGNFSIKQMKKDLIDTENALETLQNFDIEQLSKEDQTNYLILQDSFQNALDLGSNLFFSEQLGPTTGLQAQLPILLAEYAFYHKSDITNYIELLNCVDDYFKQICEFEVEKSKHGYFMSNEIADAIILQCKDFINDAENNLLITYFNEKLSSFPGLTAEERTLLEEQNYSAVMNSVIPAYESLINTLTQLKNTSTNKIGLCGFVGGKEYYEKKVQASTGSSKTIPEMKAALKSALNQSFAVLTKLSVQDTTLYSQYQQMKFPSEDPNEILEYLIAAMKDDFPTIDSVNYSVKYVHESLQDHLSPAMYINPPIDEYTSNYIYINKLPAYDMSKIFPTVAHEGYPGHLYQNVYFRQLNRHPIRSVLDVTGYDEGWATYVECYSYELANINKNLSKFLQANMIAVHCLYSLTDIGIHYDGWTKEETVNFWMNYVLSEEEAENIYYSILAEPGIYLPYSIGYLEIMHLRELAKEHYGDEFNLKEFHQFILDSGPAPFDIIKNSLLETMKK
jgi:uncharacterized protein (DUF885 family)